MVGWTPMVSFSLRSLAPSVHTSDFNWHSSCTVVDWLESESLLLAAAALHVSSPSSASLVTGHLPDAAIFVYFGSVRAFASY